MHLSGALATAACSQPFGDERDGERSGGPVDSADSGAETGGGDAPPPPCDAWGTPTQVGTVADGELDEISGIAVSARNPGVLWVHEDRGGPPEVHAMSETGTALGKVVLDGVENEDWEAIAVAPCGETSCLWIGDIGDNDVVRTDVAVLRFPEPEVTLAGGLDVTVTPDRFAYAWPEGNHNAEALALGADGLPVIVTKHYSGEYARVLVFPALDTEETVTLVELGQVSTGDEGEGLPAAATGADLWPDGSRLLLRTYGHLWEYDLGDGGLAAVATAPRAAVPFAPERQGEAVTYDVARRGVWHVGEDVNPPLYWVACAG